MAETYSPDFSVLGNLGKTYQEGKLARYEDKIRQNREQSLAALGRGAKIEDVSRSLFQAGDIEGGLSLAKLADAQAMRQHNISRDQRDFELRKQEIGRTQGNADRAYSLQEREFEDKKNQPKIVGSAETGYYLVDRSGRPLSGAPTGAQAPGVPAVGATPAMPSEGVPAGPQPIIPAKPKAAKEMSAGDRKAIQESEDDDVNLGGTIGALTKARDLNPNVFSGITAGARGMIGAKVPGGGLIVDEQKAKDTVEWGNLMSQEAIKTMAQTLKGATTDFELRKFEQALADPSTPTDVRGRIIERMLALAQRKQQMNQTRMDQLRGGSYYKPGGGGSAPRQAVPQAGGDPLAQARDAIAKGADRNAVIQRLRENNIDPSGL